MTTANNQNPNSSTEARPAISGPINNLNSAWDAAEAEADSDQESIYNETMDDEDTDDDHYQRNPFQGWTMPSLFRPVGPPPPPPEMIPMVVRPTPKRDKSTMTDCPQPRALTKETPKSRSDIKSGYLASPDTTLDRSADSIASARPKQAQNNSLKRSGTQAKASKEDCPDHDLPPPPMRTSSLRHKKRGGKKRRATNAAAATIS